MSGVWVFDKNRVARLITNPTRESFEHKDPSHHATSTATAPGARPKELVYLPSNQVISSYPELEQRLAELVTITRTPLTSSSSIVQTPQHTSSPSLKPSPTLSTSICTTSSSKIALSFKFVTPPLFPHIKPKLIFHVYFIIIILSISIVVIF